MMPTFIAGKLAESLSNLGTFVQSGSSFWLPPAESTTADVVDTVFRLILYVSAFFFVLIVVLMVLFVLLYRRRKGVEPAASASQNAALEVTWTVIPVAIVIVIFYAGFTGYMDIRTPPANAYDVRVTAQRWSWVFSYPNGHVSDRLHVPVDKPIRLTMTSEDVIHSFYVPAFRVKMDVVPGRYTVTWFHARNPGEYDLYCTEYCGKGHSDMLTKVVVHPSGTFDEWLEEESNLLARMSPAEAGFELYKRHGCGGCHSSDGTAKTGPTFKGIYGKTHEFTNAAPAVVDDNYIRESILEPMKKIRSGYQGVMPTYKGRLKDEEITAIIEYIKTLE
jgi:cytochrome c oxidase subunit 2